MLSVESKNKAALNMHERVTQKEEEIAFVCFSSLERQIPHDKRKRSSSLITWLEFGD
jgi:hypothetical protein